MLAARAVLAVDAEVTMNSHDPIGLLLLAALAITTPGCAASDDGDVTDDPPASSEEALQAGAVLFRTFYFPKRCASPSAEEGYLYVWNLTNRPRDIVFQAVWRLPNGTLETTTRTLRVEASLDADIVFTAGSRDLLRVDVFKFAEDARFAFAEHNVSPPLTEYDHCLRGS